MKSRRMGTQVILVISNFCNYLGTKKMWFIFLFGRFSDVGNVRGNEFAFMACWVVEKVKEFKKGKEKM